MARDRASRPEAKPLRLFVSVDVAPEVQRAVDAAVSPLRERFPKARWVPSENWHVTLKFIGRTWPRLLGWVQEGVGSAASEHPAFPVTLNGMGSFPSARRARVLWVGLHDAGGHLSALSGAIDHALEAEFEPEKRAFSPHLTIARSDPPIPLGEELASIEVPALTFTVSRLVLYRSHLRRPSPRYEALAQFPLGGR